MFGEWTNLGGRSYGRQQFSELCELVQIAALQLDNSLVELVDEFVFDGVVECVCEHSCEPLGWGQSSLRLVALWFDGLEFRNDSGRFKNGGLRRELTFAGRVSRANVRQRQVKVGFPCRFLNRFRVRRNGDVLVNVVIRSAPGNSQLAADRSKGDFDCVITLDFLAAGVDGFQVRLLDGLQHLAPFATKLDAVLSAVLFLELLAQFLNLRGLLADYRIAREGHTSNFLPVYPAGGESCFGLS